MTENRDFSIEINCELAQLYTLSELVLQGLPESGTRENFFWGLSAMLAGIAERLETQLVLTYAAIYERGRQAAARDLGLDQAPAPGAPAGPAAACPASAGDPGPGEQAVSQRKGA